MSNPEYLAPDYTTQSAAAYKAAIDASMAASGVDHVNIAFTLASNTLTLHDARGDTLSASDPGFVRFRDPDAAGKYKYISVETNTDINDDGHASGEMTGNLLGFDASQVVSQDVELFVYLVSNDDMDTVEPMLSRDPYAKVAPAAASIGTPSSAVADSFGSFLAFDDITVADYDGNPCVRIGSIQAQKDASDNWTFQTMDESNDGVGPTIYRSKEEWEHISTAEASASAQLDFTLSPNYSRFKLVFEGILPATNAAELCLRTSTDWGSTFTSTANGYRYSVVDLRYTTVTGISADENGGATYIIAANQISSSRRGLFGSVEIFGAFDSATNTNFLIHTGHANSNSTASHSHSTGCAMRAADEINNAIRVLMDSGNITSGKVMLYGSREVS